MAVRPVVGRRIIEALLETELARGSDRRLVLVDARFDGSPADHEFTARIAGRPRRVRISPQDSVLGVADAWERERGDTTDGLLVVTGPVPAEQLGWDLKAQAVRRRTLTVDRAEIVKQLFGATDLDPRMYREGWLLDALLNAEPVDGWPRAGTVLTRDRAVRALVTARLGIGEAGADSFDLDTDVLLGWSRTTAGPARFAELPVAEQTGITQWLAQAVGPAAPTLLALVRDGRGEDAMALGALAAGVLASGSSDAAGFALGTVFGSALRSFDDLAPFAESVTWVLARWIGEGEDGGTQRQAARDRVLSVLDRADAIAVQTGLAASLGEDRLLPSGFRARLRTLAAGFEQLSPTDSEAALRHLHDHHLAGFHEESTQAAAMAVRLVRWLAAPAPRAESVGRGVHSQLNSWGWADRAVSVLAEGDPEQDPVVGQAYSRLIGAARERREALDEEFGSRLAVWTRSAAQQMGGGALLIEDVMARFAAPLALENSRPLIIVLDGMSAAVAVQLGDELDRRVWTEVVPKGNADGAEASGTGAARQAAVSMLPSVTRVSRASLLSGAPVAGGQSTEDAGFAAFWKRRHRSAQLFHKGEYEGEAGHRLAPALLEALASDAVVGVVLNTVDDALDSGQQGARTRWQLSDITKLTDLLNAARDYGRPVLLVSDHGHVIDRTPPGQGPVVAPGVQSSRWRTGRPEAGELALVGPRVLENGGEIVAPWREDIRYTPRKAGYHGGASLAEVTVPVLALVPSTNLVPSGWTLLPGERIPPAWWRGTTDPVPDEAAAPAQSSKTRQKLQQQDGEGIFAMPGQETLGEQVVGTEQFKAQREFVRNGPGEKAVAAVVDALAEAGNKLSPGAVAAAAQSATGRSQRNPERFVTILERLLNIDGYPVIGLVEAGRTVELNKALLEQQFLGRKPPAAGGRP
ncbi:BREX-2 system phosphatase PglZ [Streptomyces sp. D54]|uniref:BREX-2 system phosphatase PglZ n=1 Tax=Streptomyces sp. D54 TaxID=1290289 RepID=UPI003CE80064